ncbi:MAG: hypothetical protein CK424_04805 [Legionella sp.]|nr:MAG: hypothetical protein CK424_04805 [Legionella sp.]
MFSVTAFGFSFTSSWKMLTLALIAMSLFIRLGFWQVHRAHEKRALLAAHHTQMQHTALVFSGESVQQYQRVKLHGYYLPITFLLDNQHHAHQFGYDVVSPLVLANGKVVLIDRGWIAGDVGRLSLPKIDTPSSAQDIRGDVYFPSAKQWLLGQSLDVKTEHLAVIETLDVAVVSQFLHKSLYPFIIRQSAEDTNGYVRDWAIVSTPPGRHDAYALQWFMFALVVGILYLALNIKKIT